MCLSSACPSHSQGRASSLWLHRLPRVMDWWKAISKQQKLFRGQTLSQFSAYKQVTWIPPQHALPLRAWEAHFREIDDGSYKWLNLPYYTHELATTRYFVGTEAGSFLHLSLLRTTSRCPMVLCSSFPNAADTVIHFLSHKI